MTILGFSVVPTVHSFDAIPCFEVTISLRCATLHDVLGTLAMLSGESVPAPAPAHAPAPALAPIKASDLAPAPAPAPALAPIKASDLAPARAPRKSPVGTPPVGTPPVGTPPVATPPVATPPVVGATLLDGRLLPDGLMAADVTLVKILGWMFNSCGIQTLEQLTAECAALATTVPCIIRLGDTLETRVAIGFSRGLVQ